MKAITGTIGVQPDNPLAILNGAPAELLLDSNEAKLLEDRSPFARGALINLDRNGVAFVRSQSNDGEDHVLSVESVKAFKKKVGMAQWQLDLAAFCARAGLEPDDYGKGVFIKFTELNKSLNHFDTETLCKILGVDK